MTERVPLKTTEQRERSARDLATLVYLIQVISLVTAVPFFIGVLINYAKRGEVRGTLADSHFRWQIRTFWFSMLWVIVGWLTLAVFGLGFLIWGVSWLWVVYRVIRGWVVLADHQPAY